MQWIKDICDDEQTVKSGKKEQQENQNEKPT